MQLRGQQKVVYDYMVRNGSITSMEAFDMGITRLSGVIFMLRQKGLNIKTEDESCVNRLGTKTVYGRYTLEPKETLF